MKKILINILLYIIFCEVVFIGMAKVIEGLDRCPIYVYQGSLKNK